MFSTTYMIVLTSTNLPSEITADRRRHVALLGLVVPVQTLGALERYRLALVANKVPTQVRTKTHRNITPLCYKFIEQVHMQKINTH